MPIRNFIDRGLSPENASNYKQFGDEYGNLGDITPLDGIINKSLRMYAVDQIVKKDESLPEILKKMEECFPAIKKICNRPKSHLKSINEIRPIDTVKRVGYESISYLASHSEDWQAKTAAGLKPARLFSRVEEEDFQIYENRVVKTLIDKVCGKLKKYVSDLEHKYHQINGIMNSGTRAWSFGFNKEFQIAVNKLIPDNYQGGNKILGDLESAEEMRKKSKYLKNKYYDLKKSRLYKLLYNAKTVTNPLNETNMLLLDRDYRKVFVLWKEAQRLRAFEENEELKKEKFDVREPYQNFIRALIQFTLDALKFEFKKEYDRFERNNDNLSARITEEKSAYRLIIKDIKKRELVVREDCVPVRKGEKSGKFHYDGIRLYWENDTAEDEIEAFCKKLKDGLNRQERNNEQNRKYSELKSGITGVNRAAGDIMEKSIYIMPVCCGIGDDEPVKFKYSAREDPTVKNILSEKDNAIVIALPLITYNEQKLTDYAVNTDANLAILPLSLFDINSYRRLQKIILRHITEFGTDKCPYCGGDTRNGKCVNCELIITKTACSEVNCKHVYKYLRYPTTEEKLREMLNVSDNDFFNKDSLFQYTDIVNMKIDEELKLIPVCPKCGR